ncbi:aldose 1-epimerase-like [Phalaenopsis equestris]|uniref:aldose 1-epimerase-like n=1 Tax=Phalaenopsis equestris TaxID=78828 RepID=UPI0009E33156|nr:aldose 1-epimerase-like [Phalaenopsis equestris]
MRSSMAKSQVLLLLSLTAFLLLGSSSATPKKTVGIYELKKGNFSVKITNWGATILSVILPDSYGKLDDVVLGYEGIRPYIHGTTYFGALVGRVGSRISGARFVLNGTAYRLYPNDGKNSIHGGHRGFSFVIWTVKEKVDGEFPYIKLYYYSFNKEQGFPGDLDVYVTYRISGAYELSVTMEATPRTKATPVNLLQHSYWNLGGHSSGTILSNTVQIFASNLTPQDDHRIPIGTISSVFGTPYDFRNPNTIESRINEVEGGYNVNYVVDGDGMRKVAIVKDHRSGRSMELWANQPAVQFYTAYYLNDVKGKGGAIYGRYAGLCLETQGFPDAVNHPQFPSQIVNPGEVYKHDMLFKFSF